VKRKAPETKVVEGNVPRKRFSISGMESLILLSILLMLAVFIWRKYSGTPPNSQLPSQTEINPAEPQPAAKVDRGPTQPPKTPEPTLQAKQPPATGDGVVRVGELVWTRTDNGKDIDWQGANQYCNDLTLDGLSRWRLPTIDELEKLYDPQGGNDYNIRKPFRRCAYEETIAFSSCGNDYNIRKPFRLSDYFVWSSTKQDSASAVGFLFDFGFGPRFVVPLGYSDGARALCVRGSEE
jgi:hypothetical protein